MSDKKHTAEFLCKVAGVTFCNEDGESRQEIIKEIIDTYGDGNQWNGPGKLELVTRETPSEYWDDPTIKVLVKGKCIGCVPQSDKEAVANNRKTQSFSVLVGLQYVRQHEVYTAKLFTPNRNAPTKNMEYAVEKILKANPKLEKPEKTFDAYRQFLNQYRGGEVDQMKHKIRTI